MLIELGLYYNNEEYTFIIKRHNKDEFIKFQNYVNTCIDNGKLNLETIEGYFVSFGKRILEESFIVLKVVEE
jgi:hypothetical protein